MLSLTLLLWRRISLEGIWTPHIRNSLSSLLSVHTGPDSEFEESAVELGLMPAGAIETINDVAFELCDEPMIEGDDPLEVNKFAIKELLDAT